MTDTRQYFIEHIHEMEGKVLGNWMPRMVENGVDACDFRRIESELSGWESWPVVWEKYAKIHLELAEEFEKCGNFQSAGEAYRRTAIYYHFGSFMLFNLPELKREMHDKCMAYYEKALQYLKYPGKKVEIPFMDASLPAYYRESPEANGRIVIVFPGADATKEEMTYYDEIFLSRGISTLTVDGPGQGETQGRGIYFRRKTYDEAYRAIVAYVKNTLGYSKIGTYGISLGGYISPRCAAVCSDDIMAAVGVGGPFKMGDMRNSGPMFPADFSHVLGVPTLEEVISLRGEFGFDDVAADLKCALFIVHGGKDYICLAENAAMFLDAAVNASEKKLLMIPEGNHVCNSHAYIYRPQVGDFMVAHLK